MRHQHRLGVLLRARLIALVEPGVEDGDAGARQRLLDSLLALARVLRVEPADEDDDLAALGQRLRDLGAGGAPGRDVVGADVGEALRRGRVGVVGDEERALGDLIEQRGHVGGIDRRDRDAVDAAREQVLEDPLLLVDRAGLRHAEVDRDTELGLGLVHAGLGDGPEARRRVDDEGEALGRWRRGAVAPPSVGAAGRRAASRFGPPHATGEAIAATQDRADERRRRSASSRYRIGRRRYRTRSVARTPSLASAGSGAGEGSLAVLRREQPREQTGVATEHADHAPAQLAVAREQQGGAGQAIGRSRRCAGAPPRSARDRRRRAPSASACASRKAMPRPSPVSAST